MKKLLLVVIAIFFLYGNCNKNKRPEDITTFDNISKEDKVQYDRKRKDSSTVDRTIARDTSTSRDSGSTDKPLNPSPPSQTLFLVFIHHSTGEDWLKPEGGNLRQKLNENNYYVTDTNYDWGPLDQDVRDGNPIGYHTDIGHWYNWFLGPHRDIYLNALYNNTYVTPSIGRNTIPPPPDRSKMIIMFKSCFSSAQTLYGDPDDPPLPEGEPNPIYGKGVCDYGNCNNDRYYTVSNIKGLYRDLLKYFATQQDKLFIYITTPPSHDQAVPPEMMERLRGINNWLVHDLLDNYPYNNVAVFDYYNVLTSNGGDPNTNDIGSPTGSHHRFRNNIVEHLIGPSNFLAYPSPGPDNHPTPAGHRKATAEFIPLLNIAVNCWLGKGGCPKLMGRD